MTLHPDALWQRLQSTFWFVPSVVTLAALGLAAFFTALDQRASDPSTFAGYAYGGGPEGARALLSALAGSMVTVVSVTFSVTVVALTVASQHFGPRLLSNFMRDKAAQLVLGTFIGTFAYCLVVLRTVRGESDQVSAFVPHLAVTGAMLLALTSVAMLIYYVHHVSASMQVSQITAGVAHDLERTIERLYPERIGEGLAEVAVPAVPAGARSVASSGSGYLQAVQAASILQLAVEHDTVVWLDVRPGDFVTRDAAIARVSPRPHDMESFARRLNGALVLGVDRSAHQDAGFPVQQLVEVALHALSPGINEPFTAITCLDRLGQGLGRLARRAQPPAARADESGRLRVIAPTACFAELLDDAFNPIRPHAASVPVAARHVCDVLRRIGLQAQRPEDREAVRRQGRLMAEAVVSTRPSDNDLRMVLAAAARLDDVPQPDGVTGM